MHAGLYKITCGSPTPAARLICGPYKAYVHRLRRSQGVVK